MFSSTQTLSRQYLPSTTGSRLIHLPLVKSGTSIGAPPLLIDASERVTAHNADLVIIGFGMNDLKLDAKQHKENILKIMEAATTANPDAEFILIATTLPNPDSKWSRHQLETFTPVLREIENERAGVAVAPMTEMHKFLMSKKRYSDMSGNGINHPNDFLVRIYVQTLTALLICE